MPTKATKQGAIRRAKLTARQRDFCLHYFRDPNGEAAAVAAGYTERSARSHAAYLLSLPTVKSELTRLRVERERLTRIESADVVIGLRREAEGMGPDTTTAARVRSWEMLGRHLGMFREKMNVEVSGPSGEPIQFFMPDNGRDQPQSDQRADDQPTG